MRHHSAFFSLAFRLLNVSGVSAGSSRRQQDHTGEPGLRLAMRGWSDGRTGGARWWCGLVVRELWTLPRPSRIWQSRLASAADELRSGRKFSPSNQRPSASWASTMVPQQLSIPAPVSNRPPSPNLLPLAHELCTGLMFKELSARRVLTMLQVRLSDISSISAMVVLI